MRAVHERCRIISSLQALPSLFSSSNSQNEFNSILDSSNAFETLIRISANIGTSSKTRGREEEGGAARAGRGRSSAISQSPTTKSNQIYGTDLLWTDILIIGAHIYHYTCK